MAREMKNSEITWIGEIPEGWNVNRNKICFDCSKTIIGKESMHSQLLSLTTKGIKEKRPEDSTGKVPDSYDTYQSVEPDDIVMCLFDLDVSAVFSGRSVYYGMISPAYKVLKCKAQYILPAYAEFWFAYVFDGRKFKHYSKNLRYTLTYEEFATLPITLPSLSEQSRIAEFLDCRIKEIDRIMEQTRVTIEEYKKLKQSIITEAVTHGVRGPRKMKDSGAGWLGMIPEIWSVYRIANIYEERNESGSDDLPILLVSINTGISDHEVSDDERTRAFVRIEDRSKYKRVYPGDLAYNMMRAWQGAFGAVRVDGMVSPAYVVAKPKGNVLVDSRYMEALLRSPSAIEEMHRFSRGITDFRLRLYWPEFKAIRICIPPYEEQVEIADFIDQKSAEIDRLIDSKQQLLTELEAYKKSVIYEYVTGKREVSQ